MHMYIQINSSKLIKDLVYLKNIAFEPVDGNSETSCNTINNTASGVSKNNFKSTSKSNYLSNIDTSRLSGCRNDIFSIRYAGKQDQVVLNENKLQSIYK